jgi:hypothetical protein
MSRYRSRAGLKANEGKLPHHVDMIVPKGGFGVRLNEMHDWHYARSIEAVRGQSRRESGHKIIRWCFADLVSAALFAKEFSAETKWLGMAPER